MIKLNAYERFVLIFLILMLFFLVGVRYLQERSNIREITVIRDGEVVRP